jgi:hypothetical protein
MRVTLPVPTYLPAGYEIKEIYITEKNNVLFLIDDNELALYEDIHVLSLLDRESEIKMSIGWHPKGGPWGIKLEGEKVQIDEGPGLYSNAVIIKQDDNIDLLWDWCPDPESKNQVFFEFHLSASRVIPEEEFIKIAKSVRQ